MARFVADASVTLAWCFEDESNAWADKLLERLRTGDSVLVPAHWPTEVLNGMLMAVRRGRIQPERPELLWDALSILPIEVEPALSSPQAKIALALAKRYGLTIYDAAYLELAIRKGLPLATGDGDLLKAASQEAITLVR